MTEFKEMLKKLESMHVMLKTLESFDGFVELATNSWLNLSRLI